MTLDGARLGQEAMMRFMQKLSPGIPDQMVRLCFDQVKGKDGQATFSELVDYICPGKESAALRQRARFAVDLIGVRSLQSASGAIGEKMWEALGQHITTFMGPQARGSNIVLVARVPQSIINTETVDMFVKAAGPPPHGATASIFLSDSDCPHIRWFSRAGTEYVICGHGNLGAAFSHFQAPENKSGKELTFHSRHQKSPMKLTLMADGSIMQELSAYKTSRVDDIPDSLLTALGLTASQIRFPGKNDIGYVLYLNGEDAVRSMAPDFNILKTVEARNVVVGAKSADGVVFRCFCPRLGVDEDQVTGSACMNFAAVHASLTGETGWVQARQLSQDGGLLRFQVPDAAEAKVLLAGQAQEVEFVCHGLETQVLQERASALLNMLLTPDAEQPAPLWNAVGHYVTTFVGPQAIGSNVVVVCGIPQSVINTDVVDMFVKMAGVPPSGATASIFLSDGDSPSIRWFSKAGTEYVICGHGNLGAAFQQFEVLQSKGIKELTVHSKHQQNPMKLTLMDDGGVVQELQAYDFSKVEDIPSSLLTALGLTASQIVFPTKNPIGYVLYLDAEETVKSLTPDFETLKTVEARNIVVGAKGAAGVVFRCFCPRLGVNEDQVTGSACMNFALVHARKDGEYGIWVEARQLSQDGGVLRFNVPSASGTAVMLAGQAQYVGSASSEETKALRAKVTKAVFDVVAAHAPGQSVDPVGSASSSMWSALGHYVTTFVGTQARGSKVVVISDVPQSTINTDAVDKFVRTAGVPPNGSTASIFVSAGDSPSIRWFSRAGTEYVICGHGNLGAAFHLFETKAIKEVVVNSKHQPSPMKLTQQQDGGFAQELKAYKTSRVDDIPESLLTALGLTASQLKFPGKNDIGYVLYLDKEETVKSLAPKFDILKTVEARNVVVGAKSADGVVFRCFCPRLGVDEDQVTGSACMNFAAVHASLTGETGWVQAQQLSQDGGLLHFQVPDTGDAKVMLAGHAKYVDFLCPGLEADAVTERATALLDMVVPRGPEPATRDLWSAVGQYVTTFVGPQAIGSNVVVVSGVPQSVINTEVVDMFVRLAGRPPNASTASIFLSDGESPSIRWFSKAGTEYVICGHGNLGAAFPALQALQSKGGRELTFHSKHQPGPVKMALMEDGGIQQELKAYSTSRIDDIPDSLLTALGLTAAQVQFPGRNDIGYVLYLDSEETVRSLAPDFELLKTVEARNVVVGTKGAEGVVFRCFCPRLGVNEDQVTGSACMNFALVHAHINNETGAWVQARQLSQDGGVLRFQVPDASGTQVILAGQAQHLQTWLGGPQDQGDALRERATRAMFGMLAGHTSTASSKSGLSGASSMWSAVGEFVTTFSGPQARGSNVVVVSGVPQSIINTDAVDKFVKTAGVPPNCSTASIFLSAGDSPLIRWFSKAGTEYVICGHGNLGAAFTQFKALEIKGIKEATFTSKHQENPMKMTLLDDGGIVQGLNAYSSSRVDNLPEDLLLALGLVASQIKYPGTCDIGYVLYLDKEETVKSLAPNFEILKTVEARNVVVGAKCDDGVVFRCFCPRLGVDEDQVTGSACINFALVHARVNSEPGAWVQARQLSQDGGLLRFQVPDTADTKVMLAGQAQFVDS